jgi:hypothetical protein
MLVFVVFPKLIIYSPKIRDYTIFKTVCIARRFSDILVTCLEFQTFGFCPLGTLWSTT